jgi:hypothetical protein
VVTHERTVVYQHALQTSARDDERSVSRSGSHIASEITGWAPERIVRSVDEKNIGKCGESNLYWPVVYPIVVTGLNEL